MRGHLAADKSANQIGLTKMLTKMALVNETKDENLRNPSACTLSHSYLS